MGRGMGRGIEAQGGGQAHGDLLFRLMPYRAKNQVKLDRRRAATRAYLRGNRRHTASASGTDPRGC
jgi:hypothetical protein